jgi:hypothetical protein
MDTPTTPTPAAGFSQEVSRRALSTVPGLEQRLRSEGFRAPGEPEVAHLKLDRDDVLLVYEHEVEDSLRSAVSMVTLSEDSNGDPVIFLEVTGDVSEFYDARMTAQQFARKVDDVQAALESLADEGDDPFESYIALRW